VKRRTRALTLLGLATVFAGLSASMVSGYVDDVSSRIGPLETVAVATGDLQKGETFSPRKLATDVSEKRVPARFAPPDVLTSRAEAAGLRTLVGIPAGAYLSRSQLGEAPDRDAARPVTAELGRVVEVPVAGGSALDGLLRPGGFVDVLITSERDSGAPKTYLALQRVELLSIGSGGSSARTDQNERTSAALRVSLRQAVLLTAAQNFAREIRLVPRAPGDEGRLPPVVVGAGDLHP
jgi:pilus assembly protein CpaB